MNGIKPDPDIKSEYEAHTPSGSGYMDDDFYEDTGELQMLSKGADRDLWLTRVPDWLWAKISEWDDIAAGDPNDQIQLGEVIAFPDPLEKDGISKTKPMRVFMGDQWKQKTQLPGAFELEPQSTNNVVLKNTYIFSEKNLPGYKPNAKGGAGNSFGAVQDPKNRVFKRTGKYRKAVPKHTALHGSPARQLFAKPLNTQEYIEFDAARHRQAVLGSNMKTNIVENFRNLNEMTANERTQTRFNSFIKTAVPRKSNQLNKAARLPRNELVDILHSMFDEYKYWPMKALKARTNQPEVYLKEVLSEIAHLVRSGPFASCWTRSAQFESRSSNKDEIPPDAVNMPDIPDSGDDEDEMEDVV
ncbi:transcription initiation factor IIF [Periconia macrospinosa]|uniref:Transcription initiation factor IIF subunit beta n=1 Tax=Periconia macrospinosa TaxID=97972 RepID=A0A2V1DIY8_9PLEO|nr:transcription initiation factor IIF [Periconia macrospinosa]